MGNGPQPRHTNRAMRGTPEKGTPTKHTRARDAFFAVYGDDKNFITPNLCSPPYLSRLVGDRGERRCDVPRRLFGELSSGSGMIGEGDRFGLTVIVLTADGDHHRTKLGGVYGSKQAARAAWDAITDADVYEDLRGGAR